LGPHPTEPHNAEKARKTVLPGPHANQFDLASEGNLSVAILSSPTFDARTVDPTILTFGRTGVEATPAEDPTLVDVNGDGCKDLLVQFKTQKTGIPCQDTTALLRAKARNGWPLQGAALIQPFDCPPYALSITALQDVNKVTDVYLTLTSLLNNCAPPVSLTEAELHSRDLLNQTRWSANAHNVPMSVNPDGSTSADLQYSTMAHLQKIKAEVQVTSCLGHQVELDQKAVVLSRPDVTVSSVDAPASVWSGVVVNISAMVAELNGEVGTAGSVFLREGPTVLDQASGFIGPKATAGVVFSTVFSTLDTHQLKVVVANETPADYDLSNNEKDFAIEVTQQPASYSAYYNHYLDEYSEDYNWPWWQSGTNYHNVNEANLSEYLYIPASLAFPLTDVAIQTSADGVAVDSFDLPKLDAVYSNPAPYYYAQAYRHLADGFDFYVYAYNYPEYQVSYAQFYRSAANDVFYSLYHNIYWGGGGGPSTSTYGTFLNATSSVGTRFVIQSGSASFGGSASIPVFSSSWSTPYDYQDPGTGAYDRSLDQGTSIYGSSYGYVTP